MSADGDLKAADRRLDTWKEIAAFFRCDERTVKRWEERRALPVHRYPGGSRSKVYAYPDELRAWLKGTTGLDEPGSALELLDQPDLSDPAAFDQPSAEPFSLASAAPPPLAGSAGRRPLVAAAVMALGLVGVTALAVLWRPLDSPGGGKASVAAATAAKPARRPIDPAAVDMYLKGVHDWNTRTPAGLNRAVDEFTQAIVRDPGYAQAYVGLANCYNLLREYTVMAPAEAYPRAKTAAERAIALDDSLAGGHTALAFTLAYWTWDNVAAEREFRRAIELEPGSAQAHHWFATFLSHLGRFKEALQEIDRAQALDPNSSAIVADKGVILAQSGEVDQAIQSLTQLETTNPDLLSPHRYLAGIYLDRGDVREYLAELRQIGERLKDGPTLQIVRAGSRGAAAGDMQSVLSAILPVQEKLYRQGQLSAFVLADTYARLGRRDEALKHLQAGVARHEEGAASLMIDSAYAPLRSDPDFKRLLRQAGFPPAKPGAA